MDAEKMAASMKQLSQDVVVLVRNELELAREEMTEKAKSAGAGAQRLVGTAVLALSGKKKIQAAGSLLPEQTIENVKEDIAWAKSGMKNDPPSR